MDPKFFECLACGYLSVQKTDERPSCKKCGGLIGIVAHDPGARLIRISQHGLEPDQSSRQHSQSESPAPAIDEPKS